MRSNFPFVISVTLPFGAAPGQQRLFLGPASGFPPALITYLQGNGWDPVGGFIAYANSGGTTDTQYTFLVQGVAFPGEFPAGWIIGSFNTGTFETQLLTDGGVVFVSPFGENIQLSIGSGSGPGDLAVVNTSTVHLGDTLNLAQLLVENAAIIDVLSGGQMAIEAGGQLIVRSTTPGIEVTSAGTIGVDVGGAINVNGQIVFNNGSAEKHNWHDDIQVDANGVVGLASQGRGVLTTTAITASSGALGAGSIILSLGTQTFRAGRAYRSRFRAVISASAAGNFLIATLVNAAGTTISGTTRVGPIQVVATQTEWNLEFIYRNATGADVSSSPRIQISPSAGTVIIVAAAAYPAWHQCEDVGAAADSRWSWAPQVV